MRAVPAFVLLAVACWSAAAGATEPASPRQLLLDAKRVVVLGDKARVDVEGEL